MSRFTLKARYIFPVDAPPLTDGVITIDGERIAAVSHQSDGQQPQDLGNVAIVPGLVNAHTHLEFSELAAPLGQSGTPLVDWIREVISHRGQRNSPSISAIERGLLESAQSGVTTIGEIATGRIAGYQVDASHRMATLLFEAIGFSRARSVSALDAILEKLDEAADVRLGISPHAPYTVHPKLLVALAELSTERRVPLAMHLAESRDELRLLAHGDGPFRDLLEERSMWDESAIPHGSRPLDYLRQLDRGHRALVVHGNYLDDEELEYLAARADRMSLVYCPRTHSYFAHEPYPLARALALGVNVAVGTDSRASNPDLNMWNELRYLGQQHVDVPPAEVLRLGTLGGAQALGVASEVGSLTPGKLANLAIVALSDGDERDPYRLLFDGGSRVERVVFRGDEVGLA